MVTERVKESRRERERYDKEAGKGNNREREVGNKGNGGCGGPTKGRKGTQREGEKTSRGERKEGPVWKRKGMTRKGKGERIGKERGSTTTGRGEQPGKGVKREGEERRKNQQRIKGNDMERKV